MVSLVLTNYMYKPMIYVYNMMIGKKSFVFLVSKKIPFGFFPMSPKDSLPKTHRESQKRSPNSGATKVNEVFQGSILGQKDL